MCSECNLMCKEISVAWMGGWVLVVVVVGGRGALGDNGSV
jgi:hypothetical protein